MRTGIGWAVLAGIAGGCTGVDVVASQGALGRLSFSVGSDFYLEGEGFADTAMVTRHPQTITVSLTDRGSSRYGDEADEISYTVDSAAVTVEAAPPERDRGRDDDNAAYPPWVTLTASEPGVARLTARVGEEVVDYIDLSFEAPTDLELVLFVRAPWEVPFTAAAVGSTPIDVDEGAQLAWLAVPRRDGARLLGEVDTALGADPVSAVVPAANVENVNEDEAQSIIRADSLYFVDPGPVRVVWTDEANGVQGEQAFAVAETGTTTAPPPTP